MINVLIFVLWVVSFTCYDEDKIENKIMYLVYFILFVLILIVKV